jgi:signal transduction histidine kinase
LEERNRMAVEIHDILAQVFTSISIQLEVIKPDGRGFNPPTHLDSLRGGFGLVGIYERCDRIGAHLSISSHTRN